MRLITTVRPPAMTAAPTMWSRATECRQQLRRERQYLERLRGAEVPMASDDLTARLLARTEELARAGRRHRHAVRCRSRLPAASVRQSGPPCWWPAVRGCRGPARRIGLPDGRGPAPLAAARRRQSSCSGTCSLRAGRRRCARAARRLEPHRRTGLHPGRRLTAAQLATLRSEGWTCPELRELGYHLVWARAGCWPASTSWNCASPTAGTSPPSSNSTVTCPGRPAHRASAPRPPAPVNVLTGRPAASDGFAPRRVPATGRGVAVGQPCVPLRAIYQTGDATFTYVSDQPAEQADDGVAALVRAGTGRRTRPPETRPGPTPGTNVTARLERGLGRILELLAP